MPLAWQGTLHHVIIGRAAAFRTFIVFYITTTTCTATQIFRRCPWGRLACVSGFLISFRCVWLDARLPTAFSPGLLFLGFPYDSKFLRHDFPGTRASEK